jgi:transposase
MTSTYKPGSPPFDPQTELLVPKGHVLRRVRTGLDFTFIESMLPNAGGASAGRPAVAPETIFRMLTLGRFYGIRSERRLCDEIQVNIAYRWFVGIGLSAPVPDHSTISRLRRRLGRERFGEILDVLQGQLDGLTVEPSR